MTIATAEGVGGTVDGSPAETLLFTDGKPLLLAQYKSPTRRMLVLTGKGGSQMLRSTGAERVLTDKELGGLVSAAEKITKIFTPLWIREEIVVANLDNISLNCLQLIND